MINCKLCGSVSEYKRGTGATKEICASCMSNRHRWHLKWFCVQYKGGCCNLCGYNALMRNLDFHHVDPTGKRIHFGGNHNRGWEVIRQELDKTICVCRHCHGEIEHALELKAWGNGEPEVLNKVQQVFNTFVPKPTPKYCRTGWEHHHPAYQQR